MAGRAVRVVAAGWLAAACGCGLPPRASPPVEVLRAGHLIDLDGPAGGGPPADPPVAASVFSEPPPAVGRRTALVLSGGGMYGAYTAGVLKGWTAAGTRPAFDVVTGISTGAIIAPLAFLGPEYDDLLENSYTAVRPADLYRERPLAGILWADSLADPDGLRRRIAAATPAAVLDRVAAEHRRGRRLYVGTTNLDTKRLTVWDLGAVAASGRPDRAALFRAVLLASASIPGFFPPVPVDIAVDGRRFTELHADGGVSASVFFEPYMAGDGGADVYLVVAGKLHPDPAPVRRRPLAIAGESVSGLLQTRTEGDILRVFLTARLYGGRFLLTAVPADLTVGTDSLAFEPPALRRLFAAGYRFGAGGGRWRETPPGAEPDERRVPRAGVRFATPAGGRP